MSNTNRLVWMRLTITLMRCWRRICCRMAAVVVMDCKIERVLRNSQGRRLQIIRSRKMCHKGIRDHWPKLIIRLVVSTQCFCKEGTADQNRISILQTTTNARCKLCHRSLTATTFLQVALNQSSQPNNLANKKSFSILCHKTRCKVFLSAFTQRIPNKCTLIALLNLHLPLRLANHLQTLTSKIKILGSPCPTSAIWSIHISSQLQMVTANSVKKSLLK